MFAFESAATIVAAGRFWAGLERIQWNGSSCERKVRSPRAAVSALRGKCLAEHKRFGESIFDLLELALVIESTEHTRRTRFVLS